MTINGMLLIFAMFMLTACGSGGGGGGGGGGGATTVNGTLIDAEIQGVYYSTASYSGMTNSSGVYQCKTGETVDFWLEGSSGEEVALGSVTCRQVTSPIEVVTNGQYNINNALADLTVDDQQSVKNVLRLLQSLDANGDPTDGITIAAADVTELYDYLVTQGVTDPSDTGIDAMLTENTADMTAHLTTLMGTIGRAVVSEVDAVAHFEDTKARCDNNGCSAPDEGGGTTGGGGGGAQASVVTCLTGKTYATPVAAGLGYVGDSDFPVTQPSGSVNSGSVLYTTQVVLYDDNTARMFRVEANDGDYVYEFTTAGWSVDIDGAYTIASVEFANSYVRDLTFEPSSPSDTELWALESFFGVTADSNDLVWSKSSCTAPTGTTVVQ